MARWILRSALMVAVLAAPGTVGPVEAGAFDRVVRQMERVYQVSPTGVAGGWLARLVLRVARPKGILDCRVAIFEPRPGLPPEARPAEIDVRAVTGRGWSPMVHVMSRRFASSTSVFTRQHGGRWSLLVVTADQDEGVVVEIKLAPERLAAWLGDPLRLGARARSAGGS